MPSYSITIKDELNDFLIKLADTAKVAIEDILQDMIEKKLKDDKIDLIISQYKNGNLRAREAWKMSGLSYQDFQNKANL